MGSGKCRGKNGIRVAAWYYKGRKEEKTVDLVLSANDAQVLMWIFIGISAFMLEAATVALVSVWFALGSAAAGVAAWFGASLYIQVILFIAISGASVLFLRPFCRTIMPRGTTPTNADMVIGRSGIVIREINPAKNTGVIRVNGQEWSAKSESGNTIPEGKAVSVKAIEGVRLVVCEIPDYQEPEKAEDGTYIYHVPS